MAGAWCAVTDPRSRLQTEVIEDPLLEKTVADAVDDDDEDGVLPEDVFPRKLGSYTLEAPIARGGMAEVYRARDPRGAIVCIKRLLYGLHGDRDFLAMFRDEAALAMHLHHENIAQVTRFVEERDELYLVMELVDGVSIGVIMHELAARGEHLSAGEALQVAVEVSRALQYAHTRTGTNGAPLHIVHRDVSPQNILIARDGTVKLVDFGIAKAAQRMTRTQTGTLKGKCQYMAPEQVRGQPLDHRADQFGMGIVLWEMLTGRRLFAGRNEMLILEQVAACDAVPPSTVRSDIPRRVDAPVLRSLGWRARERFPDMAHFGAALEATLLDVTGQLRVDLAPLVARVLGELGDKPRGGAQRTRVMTAPTVGDVEPPPTQALSLPRPETEEFLLLRSPRVRKGVVIGVLGALAITAGGAIVVAPRFLPPPPPPRAALPLLPAPPPAPWTVGSRTGMDVARRLLDRCVDPCAPRERGLLTPHLNEEKLSEVRVVSIDACLASCRVPGAGVYAPPTPAALERKLRPAADHPCRTELLEDLLDARKLAPRGEAALADAVDQCVVACDDGARLRTQKLDVPKKKVSQLRTTTLRIAGARERARIGARALHLGLYGKAKALYVEALALDPSRVDDHLPLATALRGLGDEKGAARQLRMHLFANPDDVNRQRYELYLQRYSQESKMSLSALPGMEEKSVRVARLIRDAERARDDGRLLEAIGALHDASALLPARLDLLPRLGALYAQAGRRADAMATYQSYLHQRPTARDAREIRARVKALRSP